MTASTESLKSMADLQMALLTALGVDEQHIMSAHIVMDRGRIRVRITKYVYPYEVVEDRIRAVSVRYEINAVKREDPAA